MNKPFLLLSLISFLHICCREQEETIPKGIIPQKEMVSILTDFHLAEATSNQFNARNYTDRIYTDELRLKILSEHQQSLKDFSVSLSYYHNHGSKMEEIYKEVVDSLQTLQARETAGH